jgi:Protein of unknown function (DUF2950)
MRPAADPRAAENACRLTQRINGSEKNMNPPAAKRRRALALFIASVCFAGPAWCAEQAPADSAGKAAASGGPQKFATAEQAADAIIAAAANHDVPKVLKILGRGARELVVTADPTQDRARVSEFAAQAHEKRSIALDPANSTHAVLLVGKEDWPFPIPLVKRHGKWSFDAPAGRAEVLRRRIGGNELDAIEICLGYVEAQQDYALEKHNGSEVNQYAQRIISTAGRHDGLAWRNPDGTWGGPVGEPIAHAIEEGYTHKGEPYHGYFFKVLKGQGPAAPEGAVDYVLHGVMIGGFALVAAPAEYGRTGIKTFIVSHHGVVYEKDLGPGTLAAFSKMELFNPDNSWTPVSE